MPNELTNPNNVVTEERLAQFYQQILPYLGGMPDVLANKFSKADLYSTDEKLIGRWIDGKPLYQKTVDCGLMPSSGNKTISHGITGISKIVYVNGIMIDNSGGGYVLPYVSVNASYNVFINTNVNDITIGVANNAWGSNNAYVTIQYTKTTDSAVEIGSDTDYSTTEKIVGTWIDGKPLYQKTLAGNTGSGNHSWNINVPDMEQAISISGHLISGEQSDTLIPVGFYSNATNGFFSAMVNATDKTILLRKPSNYDNKQAYVTIQYTKTSS